MRQARTTATATATREQSETVSTSSGTRQSRRGFSALNKANQTTLRVGDDTEVIVFLDDENFTYGLRHWVKYIGEDGKEATRTEWCLEDDCPLCDIGDVAKPVAFFNVVDVSVPHKVLVWEASADPTAAIQKEYNKLTKRKQHLNDDGLYWVVSREQKSNGYYTYSLDKLTEDELASEWPKLSSITPAQRDALRHRAYDETYIQYKTREELQEFVDSLG